MLVMDDPNEMGSSGDHQNNSKANNGFSFPSNLGRQSSIYSLTLDEFQNTLYQSGKSFGSMNMDEFLNSIWTAEESQLPSSSVNPAASSLLMSKGVAGVIAKQPSLPRQGSLTLPAPLCRKTVEEVWSEILTTPDQNPHHPQDQRVVGNSDPARQRQPTFGEMTLEDFLVKAGVVQEQCGPASAQVAGPPPPAQQHHQQSRQYGFSGPGSQVVPSLGNQPVMMGMAHSGGQVNSGGAQANCGGFAGPGSQMAPSLGNRPIMMGMPNCGGQVNNGGFRPVSDGTCGPALVDNSGARQYGLDMSALRGRKRMVGGPVVVEKVVERRQKRMIKNRESAARSRARKQAYTVELEAELNQLREENEQLQHALAETERQRKEQFLDEQKLVALTRAQRAEEKLKVIRRSLSCTV